jgi:hypothetical protein
MPQKPNFWLCGKPVCNVSELRNRVTPFIIPQLARLTLLNFITMVSSYFSSPNDIIFVFDM